MDAPPNLDPVTAHSGGLDHRKNSQPMVVKSPPRDFDIQRHAELLLDMGRAEKAEILLKAHRQFDSSCWIHRLMARARLAQGDAPMALTWIDRALSDDKGVSRHDEFRELRYDHGQEDDVGSSNSVDVYTTFHTASHRPSPSIKTFRFCIGSPFKKRG
jgi:hypothetical protein